MLKPSRLHEHIKALAEAETIDQLSAVASRISGQQTLRLLLIRYALAYHRELKNATEAYRQLNTISAHTRAIQVELDK